MPSHPSIKRIQALLEEHEPEYVIGADEVNYGGCAGSLYIGVYIAKTRANLDVKDSKLYGSRRKLDETALRLMSDDRNKWLVHRIDVPRLNRLGLGVALKEGFHEAVQMACQMVESAVVIVDGVRPIQMPIPVLAVPKADVFVPQVSAGAIIAKHHQLMEMDDLDAKYPQYSFRDHHGYATFGHRAAIKEHGIIPGVHREYVRFIREIIDNG